MRSSKKHVRKTPGRSVPARRNRSSRTRKRRSAAHLELLLSLRVLCVLGVVLAALMGVTFATDSFKLPARAANPDRVYASAGAQNVTVEPTMEILAPQNPQRGSEAAGQAQAAGAGGAATFAGRGAPAQVPVEESASGVGARTLPNAAGATRVPAEATAAPMHSAAPTAVATHAPTAEPTVNVTQAPTMKPVADVTLEPTMGAVADVALEPAADSAASTLPIGGSADGQWKVLDGIPQTDQPLGLRKSAWVLDSYFDDTIFVGDSVTQKLQQYVTDKRKTGDSTLLGNARFIAVQSLGTHTALADISEKSLHPTVRGTKMTIENALATLGAKKVYIMLGMNDVAVSGMDASVSNMLKFLQRIQSKVPGIEIFVQSATPRLSGSQPTTEQLFEYNLRVYDELLKLNDSRIHFVDVAYVMRDDAGRLYEDYCSDKTGMALHFTNAGCEKWVEYLYTHAYTRG